MTHPLVSNLADPSLAHRHITALAALDGLRWRTQVRDVVTRRVIPSLAERQQRKARPTISHDAVVSFASLVLAAPLAAAATLIEGLLDGGTAFDDVMLHLLAPAARRLGDLWLADRLSFLEVTRGSGVLQALVRQFGPDYESKGPRRQHGRAILLAPVPGEQHVLGLCMLSSFFRRAGWHVVFEPRASAADLLVRLGSEPFDIVGLSASGTRSVDALAEFAAQIRARALGPRIIAGGELLLERHAGGAALNVDGVARDAPGAVRLADRLTSRVGDRTSTTSHALS